MNVKHIIRVVLSVAILLTTASAQFAADVFDKYTSVGQLGLTVTNFGILGNQFNKIDGEIHPSCLYRQHSEIPREQVEHMSDAGLWVGGIVSGDRRVSTSIMDGAFEAGDEGFEFMPTTRVQTLSSLITDQYFSPFAVSHQDFVSEFTDTGFVVTKHEPLGISVHLESYAWNFSFADAFVILNYTIKNISDKEIEDVYVGIWVDPSVVNMNYTNYYEPGGGFTWYDNLDGFDISIDDLGFRRNIGYQYDADGDDGWAESYIGFKVLGSSVPRKYWNTYYQQWPWNTAANVDYPDYFMPIDDDERYDKMSSNVPTYREPDYTIEGYPNVTNSWLFLVSAGPLGSEPHPNTPDSSSWVLPPGETVNVVFTVVAGRWATAGADSRQRRASLHVNADWAQLAYDGEDQNRNNRLDGDEDMDNDGEIRRYILPEPPPVPEMTVDVGDQVVTIYWRNDSEKFIDPVSQEADFEGYKIYGAHKTQSETEIEFTLLAEYDLINEGQIIGYNTGFDVIEITNESGESDSIAIDDKYYHYQFSNNAVKNGWFNYFSVTAFDRGDPAANLASLESSKSANRKFIYPGTKPNDNWQLAPSVYPNPYRGQAEWDNYSNRGRLIWFRNLPSVCQIRIFTLAGDLIDIIDHNDQTYQGEDIQNIKEGKSPVFSGGEHGWDLLTRKEQALASGLYLFTVENKIPNSKSNGQIKEGKFLVIN